DARAGHHLAPALLASGRNAFEELGTGFTLLAFDAEAQGAQAFRDAAASLGLPLTVVQAPAQGEAARYAARWVLVRPDQFVAWAGNEAEVPEEEARRVLALVQGRKLPSSARAIEHDN